MDRRTFIAAASGAVASGAALKASAMTTNRNAEEKFSVHFAPHFGMFRHHAGDDPVAQLEFAAAQGFTAWEDNGMGGRSVEEQTRIAEAMQRLGMTMGVFVLNPNSAWGPSFSQGKQEDMDNFVKACEEAVPVAQRVNAKWMTVVLGTQHPRIDIEYQTAYAVEQFLRTIPQSYLVCKAVGSPACKILDDLYHMQISEGNLIPNIDRAWDEIAYFQIGDNPGRREPTTGEINYAMVFRHIKDKGFTGIYGMEHGNSRDGAEGEQAVIDAYRSVDPK